MYSVARWRLARLSELMGTCGAARLVFISERLLIFHRNTKPTM